MLWLRIAVPWILVAGVVRPLPAAGPSAPLRSAALQEEEPDAKALQKELWKAARDRRRPAEERAAALRSLADFGPEVAVQAASNAERACESLAKARAKETARLVRDFAKAAPGVVEARLGKAEKKAVDADRALVLRSARGELDKETIVSSSDPALERLRDLLVLDAPAVFDANAKLAARLEAWDEALFEEALLRDAFAHAAAAAGPDEKCARAVAKLGAPADPMPDSEVLHVELAWHARLATPMRDADRATLERNRALFAAVDAEEAAGIRATNDIRVLLGLSAVRLDDGLMHAARGHSKDMVEHGFFAHDSPVEGKETPWKRAALEGTSASAENIAAGQATGSGAVQAWWHSPGHHKNLLGGHARIGLGRHAEHWTQLFGG